MRFGKKQINLFLRSTFTIFANPPQKKYLQANRGNPIEISKFGVG
jgi:hypothetical protein